jgi:hypothetical protein
MPGGRSDNTHDNVPHVAHEELYEESKKSIEIPRAIFEAMENQNLEQNLITYVDIDGSSGGVKGKRRVYFLYIDKFDDSRFNKNKKAIGPSAPWGYQETNSLVLIPIINIVTTILEKVSINYIQDIQAIPKREFTSINMTDITNTKNCNVSRTTIDALYKFLYIYILQFYTT